MYDCQIWHERASLDVFAGEPIDSERPVNSYKWNEKMLIYARNNNNHQNTKKKSDLFEWAIFGCRVVQRNNAH